MMDGNSQIRPIIGRFLVTEQSHPRELKWQHETSPLTAIEVTVFSVFLRMWRSDRLSATPESGKGNRIDLMATFQKLRGY